MIGFERELESVCDLKMVWIEFIKILSTYLAVLCLNVEYMRFNTHLHESVGTVAHSAVEQGDATNFNRFAERNVSDSHNFWSGSSESGERVSIQ